MDETPDSPAVRHGEQVLTYRALGELSRHFAGRLAGTRPPVEARVALHLDRSVELPAVMLGVMMAGCTIVPLDPSHPPERLAHILRDSGSRILLTDREIAWLPGEPDLTIMRLDRTATVDVAATRGCSGGPRPDCAALVLYTSGSTGTPKGIEVTHRGVANCLRATRDLLPFHPGQTLLAITTITFDIATLELFLPLVSGGQTIIAATAAARDGDGLRQLLDEVRPDVLQATPMVWQMLFLRGWAGSPDLVAHVGGDVVPPALAARLTACTKAMWHTYGPTEASMYMACELLDAGPQPQRVPIGRPIPGVDVLIVDPRLRPVPPGVVGELCIRGVCLARGYVGMPGLTAARFVADPDRPGERMYRTGDLARQLSDGRIELHGRGDRQIKIRGHRVEPDEVESVLARHPDVAVAAVVVNGSDADTYRLAAFVQPTAGAAESFLDDVREFAGRLLPSYMAPSSYTRLMSMPLNAHGKIDRRELSRSRPGSVSPPRRWTPTTPEQAWLERTLKEILGTAADEGFLAVGGDQVRAVEVSARAEREFGVSLPWAAYADDPTIPVLARRLRAAMLRARPVRGTATYSWPAGDRPADLATVVLLADPRAAGDDYVHVAGALRDVRGTCVVRPGDRGGALDLWRQVCVPGLLAAAGSEALALVEHGDGTSAVRIAEALRDEAGIGAPLVTLGSTPPRQDALAGLRAPVHWVTDARSLRRVDGWHRYGRQVTAIVVAQGPDDFLGDRNSRRIAGALASIA